MTKEETQLLLIDLCSRLSYEVIVDNPDPAGGAWDTVTNIDISAKTVTLLYDGRVFSIDNIKPYLRPMSSMTAREWCDLCDCLSEDDKSGTIVNGRRFVPHVNEDRFLNSHHFDYRGLIPMGLALEAPEGMYKTNNYGTQNG